MTLGIFNPEHDMALASGCASYTPPKTIQRMRRELAWLPRLWGSEGIDVWGWDAAVKRELLKAGIPEDELPTDTFIADVRRLSSRQTAVKALSEMRQSGVEGLCGESWWHTSSDMPYPPPPFVLKAPWSSSGKGVLFVEGTMSEAQKSWSKHIIDKQGGIAVERVCAKLHDCALEYEITDGHVSCVGLSVFTSTASGAYCGNLLAPHDHKLNVLGITDCRLKEISSLHVDFLTREIAPFYHGPLGIDMMVCADNQINPCVEINLRRTMGHVALSLERRGGIKFPSHFIVGFDKERGYFAEIRDLP